MQNNDTRVYIWKLETIVSKLVLQSTYGTKSTYLDRGYNLFTSTMDIRVLKHKSSDETSPGLSIFFDISKCVLRQQFEGQIPTITRIEIWSFMGFSTSFVS